METTFISANYDAQPAPIAAVGNGSILYRWDIVEVRTEGEPDADGQSRESVSYDCREITVKPEITANAITKAVIRAEFSEDYQQKLVNEYIAANLGIYDESEAAEKVAAFTAFLQRRAVLKAEVDSACTEAGIPAE